jgi:RNA polymerase sigma-70 factor (ECF subfamily)
MTPLTRASKVRFWEPKIDLVQTDEQPAIRAYNPDELVILFSGEVWRFASAQVRNREDAEDIVMEVFAAAFRDFGQLRRVDNQRQWLLAIARKKVADSYRKQYRRAEQPLSETNLPAPDDMPSATQIAARDALANLPEGQREVLTLKYVNGLSMEEVGKITRRSVAATNSLLQRGRESLRQALGTAF